MTTYNCKDCGGTFQPGFYRSPPLNTKLATPRVVFYICPLCGPGSTANASHDHNRTSQVPKASLVDS